jgi:hypothetical protein
MESTNAMTDSQAVVVAAVIAAESAPRLRVVQNGDAQMQPLREVRSEYALASIRSASSEGADPCRGR